MIVRIVRTWRGRPIGTVIDSFPIGVAKTLIERGFAKEVLPTGDVPPAAADSRRKPKAQPAPAVAASLRAQ